MQAALITSRSQQMPCAGMLLTSGCLPAEGKSLLFLLPSEQPGMVAKLEGKSIPIKAIKPNAGKTQQVTGALQALLSKTPDLKVS